MTQSSGQPSSQASSQLSAEQAAYLQAASSDFPKPQSMPFSAYTEAAIAAWEQDKVFHSDWVFVCAEAQLATAGDALALSIAEEPVLLLRGKDGVLRALSNICRHRGTPLLDSGFQRAERIVCPYHAWTYDQEGQLRAAPFDEGAVAKEEHCLPNFALCLWQGLVFISLAEQPSDLAARLSDLGPYLQRYRSQRFTEVLSPQEEHWACNWKLAMENAMESYHLFKVHKDTLETITPSKQAFYLEGNNDWAANAGAYAQQPGRLMRWLSEGDAFTQGHYVLLMLPPNLVLVLAEDSLSWVSVLPEGAGSCRVYSGALAVSAKLDAQEQAFSQAFLAEDKAICERVQTGMGSRYGRGGQLLEAERIVVDFHHYLASRVSPQALQWPSHRVVDIRGR